MKTDQKKNNLSKKVWIEMDTITVLIIAIVAVIVVIFLNTFFMYLPIQRIGEQVGTTTKDIKGLVSIIEKDIVPIIEKSAGDFITLINRGLTIETKINNIIESAECIVCKLTGPNSEICDGDALKPVSEICPKTA
uniref:Transmembrane protein n=1 Tax=Pithovirus LCPAC201 TaxID=2506591 RepID=A0A481Z5W4_9VIRU|nr:MAG: uncharacterized protein LCPAC201_02360 [Pithovirus LCPAC201]